MAFSNETIELAWRKADGRCECRRKRHKHPYGWCPNRLVKGKRARAGEGAWEAHHKVANRGDGLANCEILCWPCHKLTL